MRSDDGQRLQNVIYTSEHTLTFPDDVIELIASQESSVPLAIFAERLSALQALVRYLHDAQQRPFSEIARLLGRSQKTVWASYAQGRNKPFSFLEGSLTIPIARFAARSFSPLETLVIYLRERGFSNIESARILNLDPRTTWTVWNRAKKKGVVQQ